MTEGVYGMLGVVLAMLGVTVGLLVRIYTIVKRIEERHDRQD